MRILDARLRRDRGINLLRPIAGALPNDLPRVRPMMDLSDRVVGIAHLPFGIDLALHPCFRVTGIASPDSWPGSPWASNPDFDRAMELAAAKLIDKIALRTGLSRLDA